MNRMVIAIVAVACLVNAACVSKPLKKQFQRLAGESLFPPSISPSRSISRVPSNQHHDQEFRMGAEYRRSPVSGEDRK